MRALEPLRHRHSHSLHSFALVETWQRLKAHFFKFVPSNVKKMKKYRHPP